MYICSFVTWDQINLFITFIQRKFFFIIFKISFSIIRVGPYVRQYETDISFSLFKHARIHLSISNFQVLFLLQLDTLYKAKQLYIRYQNARQYVHFKHEDFVIFNPLIQACQNCPIDFAIGKMIPDTVRLIYKAYQLYNRLF